MIHFLPSVPGQTRIPRQRWRERERHAAIHVLQRDAMYSLCNAAQWNIILCGIYVCVYTCKFTCVVLNFSHTQMQQSPFMPEQRAMRWQHFCQIMQVSERDRKEGRRKAQHQNSAQNTDHYSVPICFARILFFLVE